MARAALRDGYPLIAAALAEARLEAVRGGDAVLTLPSQRLAVFTDGQARQVAQRALRAVCGTDLRLSLREAADPSQGGPGGRWREAEAHPVVRELKRRFRAEVTGREPMDRTRWLHRLDEERQRQETGRRTGEAP